MKIILNKSIFIDTGRFERKLRKIFKLEFKNDSIIEFKNVFIFPDDFNALAMAEIHLDINGFPLKIKQAVPDWMLEKARKTLKPTSISNLYKAAVLHVLERNKNNIRNLMINYACI